MSHHNQQAWPLDEATGLPYEPEPEERSTVKRRLLKQALARDMHAGKIPTAMIAANLKLSERTITRWLREGGTTSA
jgi:DNA invertase Pin-like site-specific DNA recombinase